MARLALARLPVSTLKSAGMSTPVAKGSSGMPLALALSDCGTLVARSGDSGATTGTSPPDDIGDAFAGLPRPFSLLLLPLFGWFSQAAFTASGRMKAGETTGCVACSQPVFRSSTVYEPGSAGLAPG